MATLGVQREGEPALVAVIDVESARLIDVDDKACEVLGYTRRELLGMSVGDLDATGDPVAPGVLEAELRARRTTHRDVLLRRKNGSTFPAAVQLAGVTLEREYMVAVIRDVTDRQLAVAQARDRETLLEHRLAHAQRHTQAVVDSSPVGIITYRASGQAISANAAAASMTGGTVAQLLAQNFHAIESWRRAGFYEAATAALSTGREQRVEARVETSFNRAVWLSARFVAFDFEGDMHLMAILANVDDRKALEEQLVQAQRQEAIALLAGGIAHDFNNILAVIMSFGALAREGLPHGDQRGSDLDEVLNAARRGTSLTKQLLIFSRHQPVEKRPTDLNDSLAQIGKFLARAVGDHIRIILKPCARPVVVEIDPVRFDQILLNLAINARDAMPDGGLLEIALSCGSERTDGMVNVTVSDTGVGMTDETRKRIFEPFFTTKEPGKGTGLGLATCFAIVADAGGTIRVTTVIGKGTTFVIELPACTDTVAAVGPAPRIPRDGHGERVLIVEDDPDLRAATVRLLQAAGYITSAASDGEQAIAMISVSGGNVDLVLSDVVLPGCSGHDLEEQFSIISPRTAVLLASGSPEEANRKRRPNGSPILSKPIPSDELLRAVAQALSRRIADASPELSGAPPESAVAEVTRACEVSSTARRERVMLLDDDPGFAAAGRRALERSGFEVVVAHTLAEGRSALGAGEYDVLVTDIGLPDGSGLDLIQEIRVTKAPIPIVLVTGAPSVESASQAVRGQVNDYLQKPVSNAELQRAVRAAADHGRISRLRSKLLTTRFGHDELLLDMPGTERSFASALAGLHLVYQPIVRAADGSVYAYEALVRSAEPTLASAPRLLAAAEALGRVEELGRAVRGALAATMSGHRERLETTFVNIHPAEVALLDLSAEPLSRLARRVVLEVTEQASLDTGPGLDASIARVRELGFRLAVDDLGAGYAGLSSLVHLRPDFAKLDMSLVRGVHLAPLKRDIIAGVVDIAHRSRIVVIAEGVEIEEERDVLVELGCDLLQGYLFARPGPLPPVGRT